MRRANWEREAEYEVQVSPQAAAPNTWATYATATNEPALATVVLIAGNSDPGLRTVEVQSSRPWPSPPASERRVEFVVQLGSVEQLAHRHDQHMPCSAAERTSGAAGPIAVAGLRICTVHRHVHRMG